MSSLNGLKDKVFITSYEVQNMFQNKADFAWE